MEFIQTHYLELIILVLFFIAVIVYIAWQIKKNGLRGAAINLIVEAEKNFVKGENEGKINYVIDKVIALIPMPFSLLITRDVIRQFIQKIFDEVKNALDYQIEEKEGK
jgi:cbb3-type cytochrome oxidase subunit 3